MIDAPHADSPFATPAPVFLANEPAPSPPASLIAPADVFPSFEVLGVRILNVSRQDAIARLEDVLRQPERTAHTVYFVNAHTLNLAASDPAYRKVLNASDLVLPDGTGVRWAARWQGVRVAENLVGTDFTPALFEALAGRGYSYYLLGADPLSITAAADYARNTFAGWRQAGHHHGYLNDDSVSRAVVGRINASAADVLLVGMGNPRQEQWLHAYRHELRVPVCLAIGGLFDLWAGNVRRAPRWLRRLGHEWLWRLYQQPVDKASRYLLGNPLFLARVFARQIGIR